MDARRVDGTTRSEVDAERSRRRAALATDPVRSDKNPGAAPFRQPCTSTHNLYWMRTIAYSFSLSRSQNEKKNLKRNLEDIQYDRPIHVCEIQQDKTQRYQTAAERKQLKRKVNGEQT